MKKIVFIIWLMSSLFISCRRDPLYYENSKTVTIRLLIDWNECCLNPNGISTFIFNKTTGEYACSRIISNNSKFVDITLAQGEYYILVVNETDDDLHNVNFIGCDNIKNFYVRICTSQHSKYQTSNNSKLCNNYAKKCDIIAFAEVDNLIIRDEDIDYYSKKPKEYNKLLKVIPITAKRITEKIKISLTVNNINSAAGAPNCIFTNLSGGYHFGEKDKHDLLVNHEFSINTRTMLKSNENKAIISKEIITFGPHFTKASYINTHHLLLNFYLTDGTIHYHEIEANDIMNTNHDGLQNVHEVSATITLPTSIGNGEGPFGSEIEEWDDINLTIPIE